MNLSFFYWIEEETTQDSRITSAAACAQTKKDRVKSSKKGKKKSSPSASDCNDSVQDKTSYSNQLENKLKWAVDDVNWQREMISNIDLSFHILVDKITKSQSYQCYVHSDYQTHWID